jgi:hypothetical protein
LSRRIVAAFDPSVSLPIPPLGPDKQKNWEEVLSHLRLGASADVDRAFTKRCQDWWVCADPLRNSGFYVDYLAGRWESPRSISEEDYLASLEIIEAFFWSAKAFCLAWETLPNDARSELIRGIRRVPKSFGEEFARRMESLWAAERWPIIGGKL